MEKIKTFSIEEANQLIPTLTPLLTRLEFCHDEILALQAQLDALEIISGEGNGMSASDSPNVREIRDIARTMNELGAEYNGIAEDIHRHGCFLKGIQPTLIDFFHMHKGEVVYLCWVLGEPCVAFWHEVGKGFSERRPLSDSKM